MPRTAAAPLVLSALLAGLAAAQAPGIGTAVVPAGSTRDAKKAMTVDDYAKWKSINTSSISGDGKWVTYVLAFSNTLPGESKPMMHLLRLDTDQDLQITSATAPAFSNDSRWVAYQVDPSIGGGRGAGRRGGGNGVAPGAQTPGAESGANGGRGTGQPPRVELRNLATGTIQTYQDVQSFTFSANSNYIILRRRAPNGGGAGRGAGGFGGGTPGGPGGGGASAASEASGPRGSDVILHDLVNGRDQLLGSVGDISFNKSGDLLAYTVDATPRDDNGLFVMDLSNGRVVPIENDSKIYSRLQWNDAGSGVAVLKGSDIGRMRERDNMLVVYPNVRDALSATAKPAMLAASALPHGFVISDRAPLDWSGDGKRVFFGIKEQVVAPDTARRRSTDEVADVDVWNTKDDRIQSVQMTRADADRNFTYRESFEVAPAKFVTLADSTMRDVQVSQDGRWAVGQDARAYISDYKRPAADLYRVNAQTGERTLIARDQLTGQNIIGIAADGNNFVFWKDNKFAVYNFDAAATRTIGGTVNFTDAEYDHPGPRPSYGIDGYAADGKGVIARGDYDLYYVPFDGAQPVNLTKGAGTKNEIRYRYVKLEPDTDAVGGAQPGGFGGGRGGRGSAVRIDLTKPMVLTTYGEWTKKSGFADREPDGTMKDIVYEDAAYSVPVRAAKANVYLVRRETFTEYPDLRIANGVDFGHAKKITDANPQQSEYRWGHRQLIDFKDKDGHRLQALLTYPDDYKPGEKRPMLVNFYEKNSQNLHRYSAPSYLTGMGSMPIQATSDGYLTLVPDVYYHTGSSHSDQLNSVEAAVRKVISMGVVDPKRIGLNGHSYGGEGAAFIATRSRLFAAVGVGAGVTDLYQDFSQNWGWGYQVPGGSGANGNDYYLYGQGRWGFSPWEKPEVYMYESALTHVPEVTEPILIMHGTADPTVAFQNGLGFYNALRYNGKNAVLLAYPGEGHGLRGLANRKDLTIRYFQFFDHYLKDAAAPKWLDQGVPYLQKNAVEATTIVP
ncbi:MAG TPA: prolyl oligopeptidase family serine peptidase [Gemmatimonadaceae bacterium]|nr:prolyl oligopeptidase family serine peptidase [Gemmatimonadaceae bacterium]